MEQRWQDTVQQLLVGTRRGNDTFSISVSGPNFSYSNSGTLSSGNVQVQSQ